jgi:arsenate reductase
LTRQAIAYRLLQLLQLPLDTLSKTELHAALTQIAQS